MLVFGAVCLFVLIALVGLELDSWTNPSLPGDREDDYDD